MKYLVHLLFLVGIAFFTSSCSQTVKSPAAKHVIVIGIDGMSPDGINHAETPVMDLMMNEGSYTLHARAVMPSSSGANWGSMLMGAGPEQHGIISNDWRTDNYELYPTVVRNKNLFPTVFAVIRDQRPNAEIGAILDWNPISNFIEQDVTDYLALPEDEDETTRLAQEYIKNKKPDFTFIHIDHVDAAGHNEGHGSPAYYRAVAKADSLIGQIVKATEEAGISEETVFIISSDHGGIGYGHGGNSPAEMEIPFIISGKNVKPGYLLNQPVNTYDNPATALFALGMNQPFEWIGRPVKAAFVGNTAPKLMYSYNKLLPAPEIHPKGEGGSNPPGGLFIGENPELQIRNTAQEGILRYTLDGSQPTGQSPAFEGPISIRETSVAQAALFEGDDRISQISHGYFRILPEAGNHGLNYSLFEISEERTYLPNFSQLKPVENGKALEISTNTLPLPRQHFMAAVFDGMIVIPESGEYRFYLSSDDGSKLYINGELIVDNDGDHGVLTKSGSVQLKEGEQSIRVEWFNGGGGYWLGAYIEGPELPRQIIPPTMFYRN